MDEERDEYEPNPEAMIESLVRNPSQGAYHESLLLLPCYRLPN